MCFHYIFYMVFRGLRIPQCSCSALFFSGLMGPTGEVVPPAVYLNVTNCLFSVTVMDGSMSRNLVMKT